MRALVTALGIVAASLVLNAAALAAEQAPGKQDTYYHLCRDVDLVGGTWKIMTMKETPKRKEASLFKFIPYQYLSFYPGGLYSFVNTNREIMKPVQLENAMQWPQNQKRTLKYTLDNQGVLNLYIDKRITYSYRCLAISEDKDEYKKNDLLLTGYTRKAKTKIYKLYRRWF